MSFGKLGQRIRGFFETLTKNFDGGALVAQTYSAETSPSPWGNILSYAEPTGSIDGAEQPSGTIASFEDAGGGKVLVTTDAPHGRDNVYLPTQNIVISGGTPYDGTHLVYAPTPYSTVVSPTQFLITAAYAGNATGSYVVDNMVRILAAGSNRPRRTSKNAVEVIISGTTNYNGTETIYNADTNSFEVQATFYGTQTGTWVAKTETQINTDGTHALAGGGVVGVNTGPHPRECFRVLSVKSTSFEISYDGALGAITGTWVKGEDLFIDGPGGSERIEVEAGQYCFFDVDLYAFGTGQSNSIGYKGTIIYRMGWNHGVITPWGSSLTPTVWETSSTSVTQPKVDMAGEHGAQIAIMVASIAGNSAYRWVARVSGVSGIGYVGS